jgi:hypothetical protein
MRESVALLDDAVEGVVYLTGDEDSLRKANGGNEDRKGLGMCLE